MHTGAMPQSRLPRLEPLEIAAGMVFGDRRQGGGNSRIGTAPNAPRRVLGELLLPAVARTPCLVSFSGGRDSSVVLAAATEVARRAGLPDPVPVTMRYPARPRTWETEWQELTVAHLGLRDWKVVAIDEELDAVGDLAMDAIRRHGLFWPPNAHAMVPMLREAQAGSLVTGNGGDEIFSPWAFRRTALIRRGRLLPAREDLKHVAASFLPRRARTALWRRRRSLELPWLTTEGSAQLQAAWAERSSAFPRTWRSALEGLLRSRYLELASAIFAALAATETVELVQPFFAPAMLASVAETFPLEGPAARTAALEATFGDLLPSEVLSRSTKASFTEILWGPTSREFARTWDGTGVDAELVDVEALRREWLSERPDFRAVTALQAAAAAAPSTPSP
jgi:hypothetical protein